MREYTTPTLTFKIPGVSLSGATVHVTFSDIGENVILDIAPTSIQDTDDGVIITVQLSQQQTALFVSKTYFLVQVNWIIGDVRSATTILKLKVKTNLLKEVLS